MTLIELEAHKQGGRWFPGWLLIGWRAALAYQCGAI